MPEIKKDMRKDKDAYGSEDLISKVEEHMKTAFEDDKPPIPEPEAKPEPISEPEPEPEPESELKPKAEGEPTPEPEAGPAIPENHYKAAIHAGWTPEKISKLYETDSKLAQEILEKIYSDTNNLSRQFADLGRRKLELDQKTAEPEPQRQKQVKDFVDVKKLQEEYADNPLTEAVIALNEELKQRSVVREQVPKSETRGDYQEEITILEQFNTFFGSEDMKAFENFYGPIKDSGGRDIYKWNGGLLTPGQLANRRAVLEEADNILVGVEFQGGEMSVAEALARAHFIVSQPVQAAAIRNEIVSKATKRQSGLTMRPSASKVEKPKSETKLSDEELESRTAKRLKKLREKGF